MVLTGLEQLHELIEMRRESRKQEEERQLKEELERHIEYFKQLEKEREKKEEIQRKKSLDYYHNNKEDRKQKNKEYRNSEKGKEYRINYQQSDKAKKSYTKSSWKRQGLNMENFEEIYSIYLSTTNCDICKCVLCDGKPYKSNSKCMDHDHYTGNFRNILCSACNSKLPKQK